MQKFLIILIVLLLSHFALGLDKPWQILSDPTAAEVAANFMDPPPEYSMTFYWGWEGAVTREVIDRDLDDYSSNNVMAVTIEAGTRMQAKYLSPEWFDLVKYTVEQAKKRGMRVWLVDEGKYPSGFAGGKFTEERPDLTMQTFRVAGNGFSVAGGESINREVAENTICAVATKQGSDDSVIVIEPESGQLTWTAPEGQWRVQVVEQQYRTSATRSVNNPNVGAKDGTHALCDYLNPKAVAKFIEWTHEQYKAVVGDKFGQTVLGFRGDEPDYGITPWTDDIIEDFRRQKGYDIRPYMPSIVAGGRAPSEAQRRAKADYWDVWSACFGKSFFGQQSEWCAANDVEYLVHLNHEDDLVGLARSEGDFFRCMRSVQMPGVDAIWDQIWPGKVSDFPKLASSAAHLFGRPRSFTESFAAYRPAPNAEQAEWILNQQMVRGINMVEVMWISASIRGRSGMTGWLSDERFPAIAKYLNRVCYVLSQGRPTAKIALYQPTMSVWLGDREANGSMLTITQTLMECQQDLDFVDDRSIASVLTLDGSELKNLSGQGYGAVVIPSVTAMSKGALEKLKAFSTAGGIVIFLGRKPSMIVDKTFLNAEASDDLRWAIHEPSGELTDAVLTALPNSDVRIEEACPGIKYTHRRLRDADVYFLFNESDEEQTCSVTLAGVGKVQTWNAFSGNMFDTAASAKGTDKVQASISFKPYETRLLIVGGHCENDADE